MVVAHRAALSALDRGRESAALDALGQAGDAESAMPRDGTSSGSEAEQAITEGGDSRYGVMDALEAGPALGTAEARHERARSAPGFQSGDRSSPIAAPSADSGPGLDQNTRRSRNERDDGRPSLERARKRLDTEVRPIPVAPGRAAPVAQADAGDVHFDWTYATGGQVYQCNTTVAIAPGDGLRRDALITTMDSSGRTLVSYHGTAFRDANGLVHVDARNAPVTGPWARNWSPDSIAIDEYGQVHTMDDYNRPGGGWVTPP